MLIKCMFVFLLIAALNAQEDPSLIDSQDKSCFFCESDREPKCQGFHTDLLQVRCKDLVYGDESLGTNANQPRQNSQLATIFKRESTRATTPTTQYKCIKTTLKEGDTENLIRTCAPLKSENIDDVCSFIKQELDSNIKMKDCFECKGILCNSSTSLTSAIFLQCFTIMLAVFLIKF